MTKLYVSFLLIENIFSVKAFGLNDGALITLCQKALRFEPYCLSEHESLTSEFEIDDSAWCIIVNVNR